MQPGIPALGEIMMATDLGEMAAAIVRAPAGADLRPILAQLPQGACPVPHWGYVVYGKLNIGYSDGRVEVADTGDVFWMEPGHVVWVDVDTSYVDFSPGPEMHALLGEVDRIARG
jgi:hypothetical protein